MDLMDDPGAMGQSMLDTGVGIGSIKAVHGSPHKFSKFSDEAMGSGEGVQAFGLGHYSGENVHALDDWYRKRLVNKTNIDSPLDAGDAWKRQYGAKYIKLQNMILGDMPPGSSPASVWRATTDTLQDAYRMAVQGKKYGVEFGDELIDDMSRLLNTKNPGYTYQLNLKPDQADLLHFDKLVEDHPKGLLAKFDEATDGLDQFYERADLEGVNPMGSDLHRYVNRMYGKDEAANILRESGIPGHSFTGQAGKGEPNYVIYDPADIEIVRRIRGGLDSPSPNARQSLLDYVGKGLLND
jgi:hypothetical protein